MGFRKVGIVKRKTASRRQLFANILIVTDGEQTETNYFAGLRDSFPLDLRRKIKIKIKDRVNTQDLVETALRELREDSAFREAWIVLDRDDRKEDFDAIIAKAKKHGIHVGWSNPCIEIFFHAYYGKMPHNDVSKKCIADFGRDFQKFAGKEYKKNDANIYKELLDSGNESSALALSTKTLEASKTNATAKKPSCYCPASTLHELVGNVVKYRD